MYKAILFHPEGDFVTDFQSETKEEVWKYVENMGSKWVFYPIPMVVKDTFPATKEQFVVDTPEGLEQLSGKKVKSVVKFFQSHWKEHKREICELLNNGEPLELIYNEMV